ncbi:MAG TPA: ATP-binding protein, partial [Anaerolineae bacterium]|nr:ATP-binding protein [Anaerolineae bacterium]
VGGRGTFGRADLDLLVAFANQAATAIENARLFEAQQRRAEQFRLISEVGRQMVAILDIDHLLAEIVRLVSEILGYYLVGIGLVEGDEVVIHTGVGPYFETPGREPLRLKLGEEGIVGWVASTGELLLAPDVSREPRYYHVSGIPQTGSELAVPLRIKDRVLGVLDVQSRRLDAFDQSDVIVVQSLADQAAIAIENARLYDQAQREIADREKLQEETRRQKDYFEALFVNSPVAVVTAELDGTVVSWNPMAVKLFRYTEAEAIGRNLDDLVATDDSVRTEARGCTHQVVTVGRVQIATQRTRKDGSLVDVELLALPILVAGEKVGFIAIYVDITDLQEARRQAEAASEAKGTFLASMSHELRTPLNAILGFTQLMDRDENLTSEQQQNLRIINRSGEHLLALINDVLEMSKIEAGRQTLQVRGFDLHNLLEGLEEVFRRRAEEKGLTMSLDLVQDVPRYVRMDEGKLRQILMNLIGNAVKFTEEGSVALRALVTSAALPGAQQTLVIEVEDTGPGIALEELGTVFEPFVQTAAGLRAQEGSGLGLTISQQFALLMGGEISISTELGKGSLFRLEVPAVLAQEEEVRATLPSRWVLGVEPGQPLYRLLIVDDSESARRLLVKLLEPQGFEVREAGNGQEAIEAWELWEPHLIWMDMRMPVLDGYEASRRIKASGKGQDTVIVALTASALEEDRATILAAGCDDLVRKPFRRHEIFEVLAKHLDLRLLYEEGTIQAAVTLSSDSQEVLTPSALAALPTEWLADLRRATVRADLDLMLRIIDRARDSNVALAGALADLAQGFEYPKILTLIADAGGPE